jgi:NTE family protein
MINHSESSGVPMAVDESAQYSTKRDPRKIGVVLSGGGARGIAHMGVLAALDELGIKPAHVAGTSSGAIVGAFYCAGWEPRRILQELKATNIPRLLRPAFSGFGLWAPSALAGAFGLLRHDAAEALFARHLGADIRFEDLQIPLTIGTSDLYAAESVLYSSGPLLRPLLAATAVPVLYQPVAFEGRLLVDGGLLNNLPIEALTDGPNPCTIIIGSHTNPIDVTVRPRTLRGLAMRTLQLAINNNVRSRLVACDVVLEPPALRRISPLGYRRAEDLFRIGYEHTLTKSAELQRLLGA